MTETMFLLLLYLKLEEKMEIRLFIADDEENVIDGLANTIGNSFDDIIEYDTNPITAIEKVREFGPDIVITDINFSSGNDPSESDKLSIAGVELARKIRKEFPLIKIIASSGYRNNDIVFSKITDRDWYDEFYTKGNKNLIEIYSKVRDEVIVYKTGLIPKLCKFFAPTNYGWDIDKSIYRLMHSNFKHEDNLQSIQGIKEYFDTFSGQLTEKNRNLLNKFLQEYGKKQNDTEIVERIKDEFYFYPKNFDMLEGGSEFILYAENFVIKENWSKIVSETKDHCNLDKCKFHEPVIKDYEVKYIIEQPEEFDFEKFINAGKTIRLYQKIKYYGNIVIYSGTKKIDILTEKVEDFGENVKGTRIEMILKKIPTVKQARNKR